MPSLAELQAQREALFKQRTSEGTQTYERYYKDAERSGSAAKKQGDNVAARVSFASAAHHRHVDNQTHHGGGDAGHREAVTINMNAAAKQARIVAQKKKDAQKGGK